MPYSKAKSGLSAVRMFPEAVIEPPNTYTVGDASFTSPIRDGRGHADYKIAAVNDTAFTLKILHSWRSTGVFTQDEAISSALDPESGLHIAEITAPVVKRFLKFVVDAPGPGLGASFEAGWYFLPRGSGQGSSSGGGGGGPTSVVELEDGGAGITRASVKGDGVAVGAQGSVLVGGKDAAGDQQAVLVDAARRLVVSIGPSSPGTTITSPADVAVGIGATVPLPVVAGATQVTVQNTGPGGTLIRVRELGGAAGAGFILPRFASKTFGGEDGAVAALEVEEIAGIATSALVQAEGP